MRFVAAGLTLLAALLAAPASPAQAACSEVTVAQYVQGLIETSSKIACHGGASDASHVSDDEVTRPSVGDLACYGLAIMLHESFEEFCGGDSATPASVTPDMVSLALRRVRLPPSLLAVQPPNGRTLVNFATNFYTERDEFTRTVRLLGQRVELRIRPAQFTWHFDDGQSTTTTTPGSPYPKLEVTHDYLEKGAVQPSVDTTYTADFRVNGGGWQPVPGSVTIPGESVAVEVVEASPILVGYQ